MSGEEARQKFMAIRRKINEESSMQESDTTTIILKKKDMENGKNKPYGLVPNADPEEVQKGWAAIARSNW